MRAALRLTVYVLFPLLLANIYFWWPVHKFGCVIAIAMMFLAPKLLPDY